MNTKTPNPGKKTTKETILESYIEYVLSKGEQPKSVFCFAKDNHIEESEFYHHFANFATIEADFFVMLFSHTIAVLEKSEEYHLYEPKDKLLSFYYTFFENLKANRSFVLFILENENNFLDKTRKLSKLRGCILDYITNLNLNNNSPINQKDIKEIQLKAQKEGIWLQFLGILKFWLNDTSSDFEKTDILIEKSVDVGFDFIDNSKLNKWIDFGKFLFKEGKNII